MNQSAKDAHAGIAEVVVPGVDKIFHYTIPEELRECALPGVRVKVSLGRRFVTGYLVAKRKHSDCPQLKPLSDLLDPFPLLREDMIRLTRWISDYYFAPWGTVIRTVLPKGVDAVGVLRAALTDAGRNVSAPSSIFEGMRQALGDRTLTLKALERKMRKRNLRAHVLRYGRQGLLRAWEDIRGPVRGKVEKVYGLGVGPDWIAENLEAMQKRSPSQAKVLVYLQGRSMPVAGTELLKGTGVGSGAIRGMVEKSLLVSEERQCIRDPFSGEQIVSEPPPVLSPEQDVAVKTIRGALDRGSFETFLLYGVTGSGKTEVYLRAIETSLSRDREAIVIVPEIALTPQVVRTFRARFGHEIAVLHSGLSDGERFDQWNRIREGKARVAVGARSAVFAPFSRLGLIVVDEEHESSYKQEEMPRYHARDVAVVRGQMAGAVVVLGGATPSVESFYHARAGKYHLLTLRERVEGRPLPEVCIVDMKQENGAGPLSSVLRGAVRKGLDAREQVLLFLNRRGYAPFLLCSSCGFVLRCPNCSVSLTCHLKDRSLCCHHCGYTAPLTKTCPECRAESLELKGAGTERIEEEVEEAFPGSTLLRLDRDTSRRKGAAKRILDMFLARQGDILVGTQMVAKGHHLPGISTVGVLNADASLHLPDFRSGERTFQLLTQVAGRAGRGEAPGRVFLQTYTPEHYSIQAARDHDYQRFFDQEVVFRKALNYPPYSRLINLVLAANSPGKVEKAASRLGKILRTLAPTGQGIEILGPARAPIATLRGKQRCQILLKSKGIRNLHRVAEEGVHRFSQANGLSGVDLVVDVDPVNFF